MAVKVICSDPTGLLAKIKSAIKEKKVETWIVDQDGDFSHSPDQWKWQAWLRPSVGQGLITFSILGRKDAKMSKVVYAVYHGRFAEMLLSHFDDQFTNVEATALPVVGDHVGSTS